MKKILIIESCFQCKHLDQGTVSNVWGRCEKLNREIKMDSNESNEEIPLDCPLKDVKEKNEN